MSRADLTRLEHLRAIAPDMLTVDELIELGELEARMQCNYLEFTE
jgi:hypothetical protein